MAGPFKMKNHGLSASAKYKTPIQYASPAKTDELTDKEKMDRAVKQGKLANWNKANPKATQDEMNAEQTRIWNEGKGEEKEETKNEKPEEE